jgi:hypothetical protein
MRFLRRSSEDEMVAVFLRAEVDSARYGTNLRALLDRDRRPHDILRRPDLADAEANAYRRGLLEEHRAYETREGLFGGLPRDVEWSRVALTRDEVLDILFIAWDWWLTLSGGTRQPREAARLIRVGAIPGAEAGEPIAAAPELIALTDSEHSRLVLLEGHVRLTQYALHPESLPDELEILLGVSARIAEWSLF